MDKRDNPQKIDFYDATSEPPEEVPRDVHFDGFLKAVAPRARWVVEEAISRVENFEHHDGSRERARKATDRATFRATIEALICDLVRHHLLGAEAGIAIPLSKSVLSRRSRYRPLALNNTLPHLLDLMASRELGFVVVQKGHRATWPEDGKFVAGRRTTIKAGPLLRRWIDERGLTLGDLGRSREQEVIVLKRRKTYRKGGKKRADVVEYKETAKKRAMRRAMVALNDWLAAADITLDTAYDGPNVDVSPAGRHLVRIFNDNTIKRGGRLARGFWLTWPKRYRREHLRINGERIAEVDFKGMFVALAYIRAGHPPPSFDAYTVPPWEDAYRGGFKMLVNTLLNDITKRKRWPEDIPKEALPDAPIGELIGAIKELHPRIAHLFGKSVGLELHRVESDITMRAAAMMKEASIAALPLHDAWLCAESRAEEVTRIMRRAAKEVLGVELAVDIKRFNEQG